MKIKKMRTVVVTGGTKGIGAAIARRFHMQGDVVVLVARHEDNILTSLGKNAYFIKADVTKCKQMQGAMAKAAKLNQGIDVLVNCAGVSRWRAITAIDERFLDNMIDVNLKGVFWSTKSAMKYFSPQASIVNISSLAGRRGSANNSAYCAAKFGVVGLTQSLAKELGPKGIRVNALCPVYILTSGVLKALKERSSPAAGKAVDAYLREFVLSQTALKRLPTENEVADACLFLASSNASAITGQSINIDCGVMPQ